MDLFGNIAQLANLGYVDNVPISQSPELKSEVLQDLINASLCPVYPEFRDLYPQISQMDLDFPQDQNRPPAFSKRHSIFDLLGEYRSAKKEIVIFVETCKIVARKLYVDFGLLTRVVEAHEVAHAVTHLGIDIRGGIWDFFGKATSGDKELFAQTYSLWHFHLTNDETAEDCFRQLSLQQDSCYNSWHQYDPPQDGLYLADINRHLLRARSRRPRVSIIAKSGATGIDTIVVPAEKQTFTNTFLGENRWWPVRMDADLVRASQVKYIAVYRKAPTAAITHWARIKAITPWQNKDAYVITFGKPVAIGPIRLLKGGTATAPQSHRYTLIDKLKKATNMDDLC